MNFSKKKINDGIKRICFDIDGVICKTIKNNYKSSIPIKKNINILNRIYKKGFTVKIFTARCMGRNFDNIKNTLLPIYKKEYGNGKIIRAIITRLKPNSEIPSHKDGGTSLIICNRTHIPLQTNNNILFYVGGEERILKVGEVWEIDNSKIHSVKNNSNKYRTHLIIDYFKHDVTI